MTDTPTKLWSDEDLYNLVQNEGLSYAVQYYLNPDKIESEETKKLWLNAREALNALSKHLDVDD